VEAAAEVVDIDVGAAAEVVDTDVVAAAEVDNIDVGAVDFAVGMEKVAGSDSADRTLPRSEVAVVEVAAGFAVAASCGLYRTSLCHPSPE
jgi:hypothetical protein